MRKKRVTYILFGCLTFFIMVFSACGTETKDTGSISSDTDLAEQSVMDAESDLDQSVTQDDSETREETETVNPVEPLDVEGDPFTFEDLLLQINEPEEDAVDFTGIENSDAEIDLLLFGEPVTLTIQTNEGTCNGFTLWFRGSDIDQLSNAINEQLGTDGEETETADGTAYVWSYYQSGIVLYKTGEGCIVDINAE